MSEFTFEFEEDIAETAEKPRDGGWGVLETDMYPVTINFASLGKSKAGENTISLDITTDSGHRTTLWTIGGSNGFPGIIDKVKASGKPNFGFSTIQALMGVCGVRQMTPVPHRLEKDDGTLIKELSVVKEFTGVKCVLAIQKVYDFYLGEVKEKNELHSSYNEDGKTYLEAKGNLPADKKDKVAKRIKDVKTNNYKNRDESEDEVQEEEMTGLL